MYRNIKLTRRKIYKLSCFTIVLSISLIYSVCYVFRSNVLVSKALILAEVDTCPVCYGESACALLEAEINLDGHNRDNTIVTKNAFLGKTRSGIRVLLKQLAAYWELKNLDKNFCESFKLKRDCKPFQAVEEKRLLEKINNIVATNLSRLEMDMEPFKRLTVCPYAKIIYEIIKPFVHKLSPQYEIDLMSVWTILTVNPEPILLQLMPKAEGWPVPNYGGVCGRLEIVTYEGDPISTLADLNWHRKLKISKGILTAALDFTYKHDQYRFYLMDWSIENIVADYNDVITFADMEDFVVVDKTIQLKEDELPYWYKRAERDPGSDSIVDICQHHLSDHNIYEACKFLGGDNEPFLYPIPENVTDKSQLLRILLENCLSDGDDRFRTIVKLQRLINEILADNATVIAT